MSQVVNNLYILERVDGLQKKAVRLQKSTHSAWQQNESVYFEVYCRSGGKIKLMLQILDQLNGGDITKYPSERTLYYMAEKFDWETRRKNLVKIFREEREKQIGMPFDRIDNAAGLVILRYQQQLLGRDDRGNEQTPMRVSCSDVQTLWRIQRVERGLTTNVTENTQVVSDPVEDLEKEIESAGGGDLLKILDVLPLVNKKEVLKILRPNGDDEPPAMFRR